MPLRRTPVALAALALTACHEPPPFHGDTCGREQTRTVPLWQRPAFDVLVVLDRSPSMADHAAELAAFARSTSAVLSTIEGGVPDLRLAVVTSDLDAADAAAFQGGARCGLDGAFLEARSLEAGGVGGNFTGTLEDMLSCLYDLPLSSSAVSQPLGAAVRALDGSVPANAGFRRDHAALVVLVVTDTDDQTQAAPGALVEVSALVTQLKTMVTDPRMLVVSSIAAAPAPRLASIDLPERTSLTDVDAADWSDALVLLSELWRRPLLGYCVGAEIDLDLETPGFQVNCVNRIRDADGATVAPLPWCDAPDVDLSQPCLHPFTPDDAACPGGATFAVSLGDERLPDPIFAELRCEVACD
ncbi:MAG: hypothetical protein K8M05_34550 [Deltaproteobacteria bacterium]|nr:hypothetical protein [Kofleriaceae bacterium]